MNKVKNRPNPKTTEPLNHEHREIEEWLKTVRFRKQFLGGVSEQDVWTKLEVLNKMYEKALSAERARYDALLARQRRSSSINPHSPKPVEKERE